MGFFDFLEGIDDVASEYVGEKSLQQLYKSIATDSTTSSWAVKELKIRLRQMSNRELKNEYYEVCDCYSSQKLLNIFKSSMNSRGIDYKKSRQCVLCIRRSDVLISITIT